jgi:hypothetical protein
MAVSKPPKLPVQNLGRKIGPLTCNYD